jgi:hypothetical protein
VPTALAAAAVTAALALSGPRVRASFEFAMYRGFIRQAASWLYTLAQTASPGVREVVVPYGPVTNVVFIMGRAHRLLMCADYEVVTQPALGPPLGGPGRVVIDTPLPFPDGDGAPRGWSWLTRRCPG